MCEHVPLFSQRCSEVRYRLGLTARDSDHDNAAAARWITDAAYNDHPAAHWELSQMVLKGDLPAEQPSDNSSANSARSVATLHALKAAELGHVSAQHACGLIYERGEGGVEMSQTKALRWFRAAAAQGDNASEKEVARLLERAASAPQNDANAQYELALLYRAGRCGARSDTSNEVTCARWLEAAAAQKHAEACFELGQCYDSGVGVEEDKIDATAWYREGAELGHGVAMYRYAECLRAGRGELKDVKRSNQWYLKSAATGFVEAQYKAALLCEAGYSGLPPDMDAAKSWMTLAAKQGHEIAERRLLRWDL